MGYERSPGLPLYRRWRPRVYREIDAISYAVAALVLEGKKASGTLLRVSPLPWALWAPGQA